MLTLTTLKAFEGPSENKKTNIDSEHLKNSEHGKLLEAKMKPSLQIAEFGNHIHRSVSVNINGGVFCIAIDSNVSSSC